MIRNKAPRTEALFDFDFFGWIELFPAWWWAVFATGFGIVLLGAIVISLT